MIQPFGEKHIELFSRFLEDNYGIHFSRGKADILQVKLQKLMNRNNISSYDEYFSLIIKNENQAYLKQFIDEMATHTTNFFRENSHFEYIKTNLNTILENNKRIKENHEIRAWSAACSSGQEPYTLAMVLKENLPENIRIKILATDISSKVVAEASSGEYSTAIENEIGRYYTQKYFSKADNIYKVSSEIKNLVVFRLLNLMDHFKFKKSFDIIFCRNVMIYFEPDTQAKLVEKMYDALVPGGLFFIGHSEGLVNKQQKFKYLQPTVYIKA